MEELLKIASETLTTEQYDWILNKKLETLRDAIDANLYIPIANQICEYDNDEQSKKQLQVNEGNLIKNRKVIDETVLIINQMKWLQKTKKKSWNLW